MNKNVSVVMQKWIKKCLKKEFGSAIEEDLSKDEDSVEIAQRIMQSKEMSAILDHIKSMITERSMESCSRSEASLSVDLASDDWNPSKDTGDPYSYVVGKISLDKPDHVRLAGYEILLKNELLNADWDALQETLKDGLMDESRSIFEASLQVHAKFLNSPHSCNAYENLLNAFKSHYESQDIYDTLPTIISGVNFKLFSHERLFRIVYLMILHQEEILKSTRSIDKTADEISERFITFLSTGTTENSADRHRTLSVLNIVSVLEPKAYWTRRWLRSHSTRKIILNALSKSPSLMQVMIKYVEKGFEKPSTFLNASIHDDLNEVCITGDTVETLTFLHSLNLISQLCTCESGREFLSEQLSFELSNFVSSLLCSLSMQTSSDVPNGVYNVCHNVLLDILKEPAISYDSQFWETALICSMGSSKDLTTLWPHAINIITYMLDSAEGVEYLISSHKELTEDTENDPTTYPAVIIVKHASEVLMQPFSIINVEYALEIFKILEKLFQDYELYAALLDVVQNEFCPAISRFYQKLDKYFVENEKKAHRLNGGLKELLLNFAAMPLGLCSFAKESVAFEELLRSLIAPLRVSWSKRTASFVSTTALFELGYKILSELASHVLSTLLSDTCKSSEDPCNFYDPWCSIDVDKFLHILRLLSINLKCLIAFTTDMNNSGRNVSDDLPGNLSDLLHDSINHNSPYNLLGLLSLNTLVWNLDVNIYLQNVLNFQHKLLQLQNDCTITVEKDDESRTEFVIDNCSFLRYKILVDSYYIKCENNEYTEIPEESQLFSTLPPPLTILSEDSHISESPYESELETFLKEDRPGLRDNSWVLEAISAYSASREPLKTSVLINLLEQMQQATPTIEWADKFVWRDYNINLWFPEEEYGVDLVLQYAERNNLMQNTASVKENLKHFIKMAHAFIEYEKPEKFDGFDWFLSTVFIICEGEIDQCKTAIAQLVQFPSSLYAWSILGKVIDKSNNEECTTQLVFAQLLETIINNELPYVKYALKNVCSIDWWIIYNTLMSQCFWQVLPWSEIIHFFAICILYPPDYILYYCVSHLYHCRKILMRDIASGKIWPENMVLDDYRYHNYITFIDNLEKRYRNRVLPMLTLRKIGSSY